MKKLSFWPLAIFLAVLIFSYPFILKGRIPIPADTILGMYHPWRDQVWDGLKAGVPFKNFLITDPVRQQYLWRKLAIESFKKGQLPLWNPYTHSGMPLLANFQTAAFYPLNFIFFIFDFDSAWGVYILLQPLLASFFTYLLLKEYKLSSFSSFLGGLTFAFSGFMTAWFEWGNLGHTALWLPLLLLTVEKILKGKSFLKWGVVFTFALSSSFFAGHLQTFFYLFLFSLFYLVWKVFGGKFSLQEKKKLILRLTVYSLLFTLISSIQWLPTLQLIKLSAREIDQATLINQSSWFLPFKQLVQFLAPDFFGNPATLNYWGEWNYGELVGYVGIIPLVFAGTAILESIKDFFGEKKYKLLYCYIAILLIAFLFLLPTPIAKLPFILKIPLLSTSQPTRLMFIIDFCLAILAAFGVDKFLRNRNQKLILITHYPVQILFYGAGSLLIIIFSLWLFTFLAPNFFPQAEWLINLKVTQRNLTLPTGILFLFMISTLFALKNKLLFTPHHKVGAGFTVYCLLFTVLTIFDLFRFSWKFNPFVKKGWIFPETETIKFLKQDQSLWRMMTLDRRIFPPNFSIAYKFQTIEGYDPLYLEEYGCLINQLENDQKVQNCASFNRIIRPVNFESELIDELNIKYILSLNEIFHPKLKKIFQEGEMSVYENLKVKPRIELNNGEIQNINYQENQIEIEIKNEEKGDLVLRDVYYPGWQAELDGEKIEIFKTEYGFRKILILPGRHRVKFSYQLKNFL